MGCCEYFGQNPEFQPKIRCFGLEIRDSPRPAFWLKSRSVGDSEPPCHSGQAWALCDPHRYLKFKVSYLCDPLLQICFTSAHFEDTAVFGRNPHTKNSSLCPGDLIQPSYTVRKLLFLTKYDLIGLPLERVLTFFQYAS